MNAEVATLRRRTNDIEEQKTSLNMQLNAAKEDAADFKSKYDVELLNKIKRDNEMQSLKEDHLMQMRVMQKELAAAKAHGTSAYDSRLAEQRQQHESDMTAALEDIRSEQEESRRNERDLITVKAFELSNPFYKYNYNFIITFRHHLTRRLVISQAS